MRAACVLTSCLHCVAADLETLSAKAVRAQLEQQLGVDLTEKKDFIKGEIQKLLDALDAEDAKAAAAAPKRKSEPKAKASKAKPAKKAKKAKKEDDDEGGPKKRTMFSRPLKLSADLQQVVGMEYSGRGNVVKAVWKYIKGNQLQDPTDGRQILCDALLTRIMKAPKSTSLGFLCAVRDVSGGPPDFLFFCCSSSAAPVSMTTMNKALQPHFTKIEDADELERAWQLVESAAGGAAAPTRKAKAEPAADEVRDCCV